MNAPFGAMAFRMSTDNSADHSASKLDARNRLCRDLSILFALSPARTVLITGALSCTA
jgi:hypothetical protein